MGRAAVRKSGEVIPLTNALAYEKWIDRINAAWREQLSSIFETGNLIEAAKTELKHGEWEAMFKEGSRMPFCKSKANRLIRIANDNRLRNGAHAPHLPVDWYTLYELTKLTNEQFDAGIKSGAINPMMERKVVNVLRGKLPKVKGANPVAAKSFEEWRSLLSVEITEAAIDLSSEARAELFEYLRKMMSAIEIRGEHDSI